MRITPLQVTVENNCICFYIIYNKLSIPDSILPGNRCPFANVNSEQFQAYFHPEVITEFGFTASKFPF
jgi:hypothetical protein